MVGVILVIWKLGSEYIDPFLLSHLKGLKNKNMVTTVSNGVLHSRVVVLALWSNYHRQKRSGRYLPCEEPHEKALQDLMLMLSLLPY